MYTYTKIVQKVRMFLLVERIKKNHFDIFHVQQIPNQKKRRNQMTMIMNKKMELTNYLVLDKDIIIGIIIKIKTKKIIIIQVIHTINGIYQNDLNQ